jgi:hypothetical protein
MTADDDGNRKTIETPLAGNSLLECPLLNKATFWKPAYRPIVPAHTGA